MSNHAELIRQENNGLPVVKRGRRFIEFDLGGGKRRHVATVEPLHTRTTGDEIDTSWVTSTNPAWQWQLAQCDFQAHARSVFNVGNLIEWKHESGEWVIVDPQSINWINQDGSREQVAIKQAVTGVPNDMTLRFPNAYGAGRHFEYTAHPKRLIKHFILDQPLPDPAPWLTGTIHFEVEWTISNSAGVELYLDGVKWARTDNVRVRTSNRIEFRNASNAVLWYADAPTATDANGETVTAQYEVARQGGGYFIRVRVPREWLMSAAYPVMVDPTFTDGYGGDVQTYKDTTIGGGGNSDLNWGASVYLYTRSGALYKSLIQFNLSSIDADATCDSATLYFYHYAAGTNSDDRTVTLYPIASGNAGWPEGNKNQEAGGADDCCWDYYDQDPGAETSWAGSAGLSTSGTDFEAASLGTFVYKENDAVGTEYTSALGVARVEDWFGAANTNYGAIFQDSGASATAASGMCSSDHATTGYRPKLVVEYTGASTTVVAPFMRIPVGRRWMYLPQMREVAEPSGGGQGSITADAIIESAKSDSFTADAVVGVAQSDTFAADAIVEQVETESVTADSVIESGLADSVTADAIIEATRSDSVVSDAVVLVAVSGSVSADAVIAGAVGGYVTADAIIGQAISDSVNVDAIVEVALSDSVTVDATIEATPSDSVTADAVIESGLVCTWVSPADGVQMSSTPTLVFETPLFTGNVHFHMQLDKDNQFYSGDLREMKTNFSQTGWEYWDGAIWQPFPSTGMPDTYAGNQCRYTVQDALSGGVWYRRVRMG